MAYRLRILVVDDENIREVAAEMLRSLPDCEVETTDDSGLALDRIRTGQVNPLLTDLQMPRMTGAQILAEARALNPTSRSWS